MQAIQISSNRSTTYAFGAAVPVCLAFSSISISPPLANKRGIWNRTLSFMHWQTLSL